MFASQRRIVIAIATVLALAALGIVASVAVPYDSSITLSEERVPCGLLH